MGNPELCSLLVIGATSVLRHARDNTRAPKWLGALLARRPFKVVAVALASKRRFSGLLGVDGDSADVDWHEARRLD